MTGALIAATAGVVNLCSLSTTLSKTAAPSGNIVTSDLVTVSVPAGNSGQLTTTTFSFSGVVTPQYNVNGGGWLLATDGGSFTLTNGQTLQVRITNATAGESWTFTLRDETRGVDIGTYTILAS